MTGGAGRNAVDEDPGWGGAKAPGNGAGAAGGHPAPVSGPGCPCICTGWDVDRPAM